MKQLRDKIRQEIVDKGVITDKNAIERLVDLKVKEHITKSWREQIRDQFNSRFRKKSS